MYTYAQVHGWKHVKHRFKVLPKLDKSTLNPLWVLGSYDGIMSAIVLHNDTMCYAECGSQPLNHKNPRRFFVYRLSENDAILAKIDYALFRNLVGIHQDIHDWKRQAQYIDKPDEVRNRYYKHPLRDARPTTHTIISNDSECIGWFEGFNKEQI
jgi:hypothetical protein